ncbi:YEATS family protein [Nitzschia inconspicua]|uniref:YEATS family protein n=1 Tax=Nitzschia inconspicua TaxID=303405 RepID=A0A9K3PPI3_9STRA|nr:YEATS family protein [Nitzschia inconspicua]
MDTATSAGIPSAPITPRLSRTTACLPIVYGSIAYFLGKKADENQTHEWTLFLRGPNHEDLSPAIAKVIFQLHPSFAQPTRELTTPPYKVTERGWGEFEAQIHIHWKDATEKTTIVNHTIKLYPPGTPPNVLPTDTETPVVAETYDEVVFTDPSESFFRALTEVPAMEKVELFSEEDENEEEWKGGGNNNSSGSRKHPSEFLNSLYSDQEDFLTLIAAQKFLQDELEKAKQRFQVVNEEIAIVDQKLVAMQQQKQREAAISTATAAAAATSTPPPTGSGVIAAPKSAPPPGSTSAATTATASKMNNTSGKMNNTSGKRTKAPSSQRKRPASQTKKPKTGTTTATTTGAPSTSGAPPATAALTTPTSAPVGKVAAKK